MARGVLGGQVVRAHSMLLQSEAVITATTITVPSSHLFMFTFSHDRKVISYNLPTPYLQCYISSLHHSFSSTSLQYKSK